MTSVAFFDTAAQADESTRVAGNWLREQKLETALPNRLKITSDTVVHKTRELVQASPPPGWPWHRDGPHTRAFSALAGAVTSATHQN